MYVKEIWRYPVKSMAGEPLRAARLTASGTEGDRVVQVRNARGRTVTSRTSPGLLGFHATTDENGDPLVDGKPLGTIRTFSLPSVTPPVPTRIWCATTACIASIFCRFWLQPMEP